MTESKTLDARGLKCPMPIIKAKKELDTIPTGEILKIVATDPGSVLDFQGWVKANGGLDLVKQEEAVDDQGRKTYIHFLRKK